jgi:hypothetical protein
VASLKEHAIDIDAFVYLTFISAFCKTPSAKSKNCFDFMFPYVGPTQNIIPQEDLVITLKWLADYAVSL